MGQAVRRRFENGSFCVKVRLLCDISNPHTLLAVHCTIVRVRQSTQNFEQRGLAGTVAANQADPFTGLQRKSSVVQQGHMPEGQLSV